jgi:hypothetical protein
LKSFEDQNTRKSKPPGIIFTEQGVLVLLQLSRAYCRKIDHSAQIGEYRQNLGKAILLINDLLANIDSIGQNQLEGELRANYINRITPFLIRQYLFVDSDEVRYALPRSKIIFELFKDRMGHKFDISSVVKQSYGFDLNVFFETSMFLWIYWGGLTSKEFDKNYVAMNPDTVFSKMIEEGKDYQSALKAFSQDAIMDPTLIPNRNDMDAWRCFVYQMYDLRRKPLLRLGENLYCGSMKFLGDLWWHAPYYLVIDKCVDKKPFFEYLGDAFEEYIFRLSKNAFGERCSRFVLDNGNPLNDGVVELALDWKIVIEAKAARPTKEMTSGNTPLLLMKEFETKIKKGIRQLAKRIQELRSDGFIGRISPCMVAMGFLPLDMHIWEIIHDGIRETVILADENIDCLIISDPAGWELFCALVTSGVSAESILNLRLSRTDLKYGNFKDFLRAEILKKDKTFHVGLVSLFEDFMEGLTSGAFGVSSFARLTESGIWKKIFIS